MGVRNESGEGLDEPNVHTVNDMTIITSNDPHQPPMIIMPNKTSKNQPGETSSTFYSERSKQKNLMNDYMQKMMMLNMMNQLNEVNETEENPPERENFPFIIPLVDEQDEYKDKKKKSKPKKEAKQIGFDLRMPRMEEPRQSPLFGDLGEEDNAKMNMPMKTIKIGPSIDLDDTQIEIEPPREQAEEPLKVPDKKDKVYHSGLTKLWKMAYVLKYFRFKDQINKAKLKIKLDNMDEYYTQDLEGITDKALYMLKKQLSPILIGILEENNFDTDIEDNEDSFNLLQERIERILDSLIQLSKIKLDQPFQYPVVISFLANYCLGNCVIPNGYLTQFEFERLKFSSTGLTM